MGLADEPEARAGCERPAMGETRRDLIQRLLAGAWMMMLPSLLKAKEACAMEVMGLLDGLLEKGGRAKASGWAKLVKARLRWPEKPQRAQQTGSLQASTLCFLERQRKQHNLSDALNRGRWMLLW
jgi:hypothetical protein